MLLHERKSIWDGVGTTLGLAIPLMAAQIAVVALGLIDTITFGQLGMTALAGGGLGTAIFSLVNIVCVGVLTAVGNEVAYAKGAGDERGVLKSVQSGMIVAVGLGLVASIMTAYCPPLLTALGQSPNAVHGAGRYLAFAAAGIIPSLLFTCLRGLLVGLGKPGPITAITIAAVLLKGLLNIGILKLAGSLPFEEQSDFGLAWSGIASTVTYSIMAIALWASCKRKLADKIVLPRLDRATLHGVRETLRLGIPIGVTYGVEAGLFTGVALIVGRFGDVALAAHQIANQCVYIAFMLSVGLSYAASVRAGQAAGAGDMLEARRLSRQALLIGLMITSTTALIFLNLGHQLADWLVGADAEQRNEIIDLAARLMIIAAWFQWIDGTQSIAMGALRGLKDTRSTMIAATIGYWVIGLPAAWIFSSGAPGLGVIGAWWGLAVGLLSTATMLVLRLEISTAPPRRLSQPITA
jgi:MATE family multidrug resistance protein